MICTLGMPCEMYDEPEHYQAYRQHRAEQRNNRVAADSKQICFFSYDVNMKILDSTASNISMWYQKENPFTIFLDKRCGKEYSCTANTHKQSDRIIRIFPDIQAQWQNLPFKSDSFDMVIWDPPHLFKDEGKTPSLMSKRYGLFYNGNWKEMVTKGSCELFRVLKSNGIFILKWCEVNKDVSEVLKLLPYSPMFGTRTGQKNNTHWICFIKYNPNHTIDYFY